MKKHILLITCRDAKGLIAKITTIVYQNDLNVLVMKEFVEEATNTFFMRSELSGALDKDKLYQELVEQLPEGARIVINPKQKKDLVVLATKEHHCLSDLLARHHFDELHARIHCVISNHNMLKSYTERFNIPFYYISHENKSREQFEKELYEAVIQHKPDYLVLAKFMRILSPNFVAKFENRILNIHHSFLPAFVGANPYRQAYERGVKLIGATAHIVNNDLDEGPILVQQVTSVDHSFSAKDMVQSGHEVEVAVLAEALKLIVDDRVFVTGNKTIIFR
jgi:formyltetrahydrofolate deformylase